MTSFNKDEWNSFVSASPQSSFLQSWEWGEFQVDSGAQIWRLKTSAAAALVIKRSLGNRCWLYVPRGPVFNTANPTEDDWNQIEIQILGLAREQKAIFVRTEPPITDNPPDYLATRKWRKADHDIQPRHTTVLNIDRPEDELLQSFHSKTRYNIRLAKKKGVNIRFSADQKDLEAFLELTNAVTERSPFQYHQAQYYEDMLNSLAPTSLFTLAVAEHDNQILAVHLLFTFAQTATYVHGASDSKNRQLMGPHLLQWESILRAKQQGDAKYDFFGVASPSAPDNHPWAGITRFKLGFNGGAINYIGAYDFVLDSYRYLAFTYLRKLKSIFK